MAARKSFLLRIEPGLYQELEGWAQQELRSVNGQIEYVLKQAVARRKHGAASADAPQATTSTGVTAGPEAGVASPADDG